MTSMEAEASEEYQGNKEDIKRGRAIVCACAVVPLTIAATFCGIYWTMLAQAQNFDEAGAALGINNYYDSCGGLGTDSGSLPSLDTKWSVVLTLNSILYLVLVLTTLSTVLGAFFKPFLAFSVCGCCCGLGAELAAIIVTGVMRYSEDGEKCAKHTMTMAANGDTFEDHGNKIQNLFISQCVLFSVLQCFSGCAFFVATEVARGFPVIYSLPLGH